jgi:hypothetical protein
MINRGCFERLQVLSSLPGRLRVHLPNGHEGQLAWGEARLRQVPGVQEVRANRLTGNVLIHFNHRAVGAEQVLAALSQKRERKPDSGAVELGRPLTVAPLIKVGVRGLLGHAVVDSVWFAAGFLGKRLGLPLAWLGPLHVLLDIAVWGAALRSGTRPSASAVFEPWPVPRAGYEGHRAVPRFAQGGAYATSS